MKFSKPDTGKLKAAEISMRKQRILIGKAREECFDSINSDPPKYTSGLWCNRTWDGIACWTDTHASSTATQICPSYIIGFNKFEYASRRCTETGEWFRSPKTNKSWTDYSRCITPVDTVLAQNHIHNILGLTNFGYVVSLISLLVAIVIMVFCRRFHYKSNVLHINLFLAFSCRSLFSVLRQNLFTYGFAMSIDFQKKGDKVIFKDGPHWECRLLFTLFVYGLCASQVWILVEGFYLQMLIHKTLFTQQRSVKFYIIFGWCFPFTFLIPWIFARIYYDNTLCWSVNTHWSYLWIIRGPITLTIIINFLFFLDNIRVLRERTRARGNSRTFRKLAKFTVMLVPLFGVPNLLFMMLPPELNVAVDVPFLYVSMLYSSFQGLILSLLFCFLHEQVHINMKRKINRYVMRRDTVSLRSSTGHYSCHRQNSAPTQHVQCPTSDLEESIQLQLSDIISHNQDKQSEHSTEPMKQFSINSDISQLKSNQPCVMAETTFTT
ncbi:calcitonin gene-related peptide type 1 receptor [Octopus bimaculoides]|uniref:calcitonin gene-related peptide type 1 receptor n=1 Tax=Octopus bimaculoides TaxID=37653 RepID=UPI0022E5E6C1|nr:calcitonin gene-related peptide type 1 receptor [Octopus bimaculoides]